MAGAREPRIHPSRPRRSAFLDHDDNLSPRRDIRRVKKIVLLYGLLGGVLMFFRPLLVGIARALVLTLRPRPTKDELAARRTLRDAKRALPAAAVASVEPHAIASRS